MEELNDASDACDASPTTAVGYEHETPQQALQRQLEVEAGRNESGNLGVLKTTSEDETKDASGEQGGNNNVIHR